MAAASAEGWSLQEEAGTSVHFMLGPARQNNLILWRSLTGDISGMVSSVNSNLFARQLSREEYLDMLTTTFPALPEAWRPKIASQLAVGACLPTSCQLLTISYHQWHRHANQAQC